MGYLTVNAYYLHNLFQTRLADVQDTKETKLEDKEHLEKKEMAGAKKENECKDEVGEKSKRSASHLISFFSQSKSSKNKDKEKENTKEKEKEKGKSKDKDKGRSTPPPGKQASEAKSNPVGKLERKGSTGSTTSQGKSWRKSLGILGGSSKHDKEEKHKKHTDHRGSAPAASAKQDENALKSVKESKDEKSGKIQPERRTSTPTSELQTKSSQSAPVKQDNKVFKVVKEKEEEKPISKQPERKTSTPTAELLAKHSHARSTKQEENSLKAFKDNKEDKSIKKQNERRSNPTTESQMKNSQAGTVKHDEPSLKTLREKENTSTKTQPNSQTRVKTNDNGSSSSENAVQLREKKGRLTSDERREKARSLGDIGSKLHKVEVSILDPTVPPSRTVDTMDIPDQLVNAAKRPMSSNAVLETPPLAAKNKSHEQKTLDSNGVHKEHVKNGSNAVKSSTPVAEASLNGRLTEYEAAVDKKPPPSSEGSGNEGLSAPGRSLGSKSTTLDQETRKVASPAKNSRSASGSSILADISELSAELSAAIASPPPQPIRLSMSESNLLSTSLPSGSRGSATGKDQGTRWIPLFVLSFE